MNFDKILEYQSIDKELIALENEVATCPEINRLFAVKQKIKSAGDSVMSIISESNDMMANGADLNDKINKIAEKIKEFDGVTADLNSAADAGEAAHYLKMLDDIIAELVALEKDIKKDSARSDDLVADFNKYWEAGTKLNEEAKVANDALNAYVQVRQPKANDLKAKLAEISKDIPAEVLSIYQRLRASKKFPAVVQYDKGTQTCRGCGIEVSPELKKNLKAEGDYAECTNCGRIIFVK
ncbi:MAG: C4-type zinc ribbon domain-containing protein [Clostridia bacterium]|nr:C4-type zinc ribbon domain-containing protein [Clostridia bacterium]